MNSNNIPPPSFFARPADVVAPDLLGKYLVRKHNRKEISGIITETEAYIGPEDKASHASRGETERNKVMFGEAGIFYIYLVYGIHWMLNIVTDKEDYPSAVLIRGVGDYDGPAKLTKNFYIDKSFNRKSVEKESGLWLEDRGYNIDKRNIEKLPRVGVDYAEEWADKPLRFKITG